MRQLMAVMILGAAASCGALAWAAEWPSAARTVALLQEADAALAGFSLERGPATYTRENLREYLGDGADRYFAYDYQWTVAGSFRHQASGALIGLDVYCFGSALDAFGATTIDRDANVPGELVPLPGQASLVSAYFAGNQLHVWRGPLYVRVVPGTPQPGLRAAALQLGEGLVERLPATEREPAVFRIPPTRGLIAESVRFLRRNVLGQAPLSAALTAKYGRRTPDGKLDADLELLLFVGRSPQDAAATLSNLSKYLGAGAEERPVVGLGEAAFTMRHPDHGNVYVMRQGAYVAMLRQVKRADVAEALLREIGKNIRTAKQSPEP